MTGRLVLSVLLIGANAFFVAAEFAFVAARRTRIEHLASEGNRSAKRLLSVMGNLSLMLAGAQLGITMASLGLGFVAEPLISELVESLLDAVGVDLPETLLHTISFSVSIGVVVFFHMVFGEMVPKNIAISEPVRSALALTVPFQLYVRIFRPVIRLFNGMANLGVRLLGIKPVDETLTVHDADEIARMLEESYEEGVIEDFEHELLNYALEFGDKDAADVMVPRREIVSVGVDATPQGIEEAVRDTGHSRIPVYDGDLDHVAGFVHAKDLLAVPAADRDVALPRSRLRDVWAVPASRKLGPLLLDMRRSRSHVALVVDEHGGTEGIVTLEDVLEELVGDIRDEYDPHEAPIRFETDRFVADAGLRPDEIEDGTGLLIPEGDYDTLGGFVLDRLGRIPERGDEVHHDGWTLRVRSMDGRRVATLELLPDGGDDGATPDAD